MAVTSRQAALSFLLVGILLWAAPGLAQNPLAEAEAALERWDGEQAYRLAHTLLSERPQDPHVLALLTKGSFYRAEYRETIQWAERWGEIQPAQESPKVWKAFAEQTAWAVEGLKTYTSPHFVVSLHDRKDGVLAEYALAALEQAYDFLGRDLGHRPSAPVRIEIFPDHERFHAASSLSKRDIEVAGAVGICKFNKIMLLSPRVLLRGYRWLDALVHEYVHYVIVKLSDDHAPIWIHEGVAKHEESRWRSPASLYLNPLNRTLLAKSLQTGEFVAFDQMEPSLVRLETPQQVQLAYAEGASAVDFILQRVGYPGLETIFREMAGAGERGAKASIERALGISFATFEEEWKQFLRAKKLSPVAGVQLPQFKVLDKEEGDEDRLEQDALQSAGIERDVALGDLMRQRGRHPAAVYYYDRAHKTRPESVFLLNKLAQALIVVQRLPEAVSHLQNALEVSPDHGTSHATLGDVYRLLGRMEAARAHYEQAIQINPFNPVPHRYLAELYRAEGDTEAAERETRAAMQLLGR